MPPFLALLIFVSACVAGFQFRRLWAAEYRGFWLWFWGLMAAVGLLTVAFIPLAA